VRIKIRKSAKKHRIGTMHIAYVIENFPSRLIYSERNQRYELHWIGRDTRGREIEVFAIEHASYLEVFHAMPYWYRKRKTSL
jgi:hypothetical protein